MAETCMVCGAKWILQNGRAALAEVTRLQGRLREGGDAVTTAAAELAAERAAHEATKAELAGWRFRAESAEGCVGQMYREIDTYAHGKLALRCEAAEALVAELTSDYDAVHEQLRDALTAFDQARGLLEDATEFGCADSRAACDAWLRAHPDTTAATGAEPEEDTESLIEQLDEALCTLLHRGDEEGEHSPRTHLDLFYARQKKEQGT